MFTRQHYERVAQTIAETGGKYEATEAGLAVDATRSYIANELADMFAEDNPRFNRKLFLAAADVPVKRFPLQEAKRQRELDNELEDRLKWKGV